MCILSSLKYGCQQNQNCRYWWSWLCALSSWNYLWHQNYSQWLSSKISVFCFSDCNYQQYKCYTHCYGTNTCVLNELQLSVISDLYTLLLYWYLCCIFRGLQLSAAQSRHGVCHPCCHGNHWRSVALYSEGGECRVVPSASSPVNLTVVYLTLRTFSLLRNHFKNAMKWLQYLCLSIIRSDHLYGHIRYTDHMHSSKIEVGGGPSTRWFEYSCMPDQ